MCLCLSLSLFVYISVCFLLPMEVLLLKKKKKKRRWTAEKKNCFKFFLMGGAVGNRYDGVLHNRCYRCVLRLFCV